MFYGLRFGQALSHNTGRNGKANKVLRQLWLKRRGITRIPRRLCVSENGPGVMSVAAGLEEGNQC